MKGRDEASKTMSSSETSDWDGIGCPPKGFKKSPKEKKDYSRVWRDINGDDAWMNVVQYASKKELNPKFDSHITKITATIKAYHALDKTNLKKIPKRIKYLKKIEQLCEEYIKERGPLLNKKEHHKSTVKRKPKGHIDLWVTSLAKRASKKREYLTHMRKVYKNKKDLIHHTDSPSKMKKFIESHQRTSTQTLFELFEGTSLEKIDPYHRPFEFSIKPSARANTSPLNRKAIEYLGLPDKDLKKKKVPPFFLWLEASEFSTKSRWDKDWNPDFKGSLSQIDYTDHKRTEVHISPNYLLTKEKKPFNTKDFFTNQKIFTREGSMAFIWNRDKDMFYTTSHVAGRVHHSSLTAGGRANFAGMWLVENGKVVYISNNSGHYRPNSLSFYLCVRTLYENNLLTDKTVVQTHIRTYGSVSEFLRKMQAVQEIRDYLKVNRLEKLDVGPCNKEDDAEPTSIKP